MILDVSNVIGPMRREPATSASTPSRKALQEAYTAAVRMASRLSMMGALGFGVALVMAALLITRGGFRAAGLGVELILLVGGLAGGLAFTVLALRASRVARECRRRLDERPGRDHGGGAS